MARMRAADRRRQLLEVAAGLFARRGYRGATTAELAREAGITEPILYRHFKNKLDLFVTLIETVSEEVIAAWRIWLDRADSPAERLDYLLAGNPATSERGRDTYRVIFKAMLEQDSDPRISQALKDHVETLHAFVTAELESLQQQGAVRDDEPASQLASLLVDVATGYGILEPLLDTEKSMTRKLVGDLIRA